MKRLIIGMVTGLLFGAAVAYAQISGGGGAGLSVTALSVTGTLSAGTAATGSAGGDISGARAATTGKIWLGSNGSQTLDFGIATVGKWTMIGGDLNITNGATFNTGTTDAFSYIIKTNNATALTIASGGALTAASTAVIQGATLTVGVPTTTSGSLVLSNATGSGTYTLAQAATTTTYTETTKAVAPATGDILDYSNGTGQRSSLVDVATGQVLTSGGVGVVPAYSGSPTLSGTLVVQGATLTIGVPTTTSGTLVLSNATGSGTYTLAQAATTTTYTETAKAVVPAQGDLLTYTNGTGQRGSVVDVAVGQVLISGGVGAVPTYTPTLALGIGGTTSGTLTLANSTGVGLYSLAQAASTTTYTETTKAVAPAQGDILDYSNATGQRSSLVDVATGSVVVSGGVGAVPTYSSSPTLGGTLVVQGATVTIGVPSTTSGTLVLSNATGSGTYTLAQAATTTTYTETAKAVAPAQGDILDYSNATGQRSSLVDVAVGSVIISGGVGAVPTYGTVPAAALSATSSVLNFYRTIWGGSANATVSNSAANVWPASGNGTAVATTSEGTVTQTVAIASRAKNLDCRLTNAAGTLTAAGGTNYVIALRQNLATSILTCTIATAATNCQDSSDSVTLAAGDQLAFIDTPSGTPTALIPHCTVELDI